jgi:rod shape-determining protein MreD
MVVGVRPRNGWLIWLTLAIGMLLSIIPMGFMEVGRPLWLALILSFWTMMLPHRFGLARAWFLGLAEDVLYGSLLGQNALILTLITFLVMTLHRRLRMFPRWQQSMVLLVVFGLAQLLQLWLYTLSGNRPPTLMFLLPALVSALLWPLVFAVLYRLSRRFQVN